MDFNKELMKAVNTFPKYCRVKGRVLLELMIAHNVPWDDKGQIFDENKRPIANSHILDLIRFAVDNRSKGQPPIGWEQMKRIAVENNIPRQYLVNIDVIENISTPSIKYPSPQSETTPSYFHSEAKIQERTPSYFHKEIPKTPIHSESKIQEHTPSDFHNEIPKMRGIQPGRLLIPTK